MVYVYTSDLQNTRMEEVLDRDETLDAEIEHLTDREVFTEIWTRPRRVFRFINATNYDRFWYPLVGLAGLSRAMDSANMANSLGSLMVRALIGVFLGWLAVYIGAAILNLICKIFSGKGDTNEMYRSMVYAYLPLSIFAPFTLLYKAADISQSLDLENSIVFAFSTVFELLLLAATVYFFALLCVATSVVQRIPLWKAAIAVIVPVAILIFGLLALIFGGLRGI